ncbi:MAG: hypothetical protein AAAFM81_06600 [Pseudomonadota bacterium]
MVKIRAIVIAMLLAWAVVAEAQTFSPACTDENFRQFDFWLGEWDVKTNDGKVVGTNRISRTLDGCVVLEEYTTPSGFLGKSFNIFDKTRGVWHQTWVDNSGLLLNLEGGVVGDSMVLSGVTTDRDGATMQQRITWTPNTDGTVRQLWEAKSPMDDWQVVFDGTYQKRAND